MRKDIELDWDEEQIEHILKHGVGPHEVEGALEDRRAYFWSEGRLGVEYLHALGKTIGGRLLHIILSKIRGGKKKGLYKVKTTIEVKSGAYKKLYNRKK